MAGVLETRYEKGGDVTYRAAGAVEAARLVKIVAAGVSKTKPQVNYTTAATDQSVGAVFADKASGQDVGVSHRVGSWQKLEAHGAIAVNKLVYPAASGRVQAFDGAVPAGAVPYGLSLHAAAAAGDSVWVKVL